MKSRIVVMLVASFVSLNSHALSIKLENSQAQALYQSLTAVQEDGAAGHIYKKGKSVLCVRTNAPIDDVQGKPISAEDARRYTCTISFDKKGFALPGQR